MSDQTKELSTELAEAEVQLRGENWTTDVRLHGEERKAVAVELDRLRAEVDRLKQPTRTCWVGASSEEEACEAVAYASANVSTDEDEPVEVEEGQEVYEVELRAKRAAAQAAEGATKL